MPSIRYGQRLCTTQVACDGLELAPATRGTTCSRCKETADRRKRTAKENARIEKLLKQAEIALPEDRCLFAGRPARKTWNRRTRKATQTNTP